MKLLDHFKAMQGMVSCYLEPGPYEPQTEAGKTLAEDDRDRLIQDLIWMLDGPEQRAAERDDANAVEGFKAQVGDLEDSIRAMRDRVAVSESDKMRAVTALGEERKIQNDLRTLLFDSEMRYAKLVGYVEGRRDAEPPRMVPEQRESALSWMHNTRGPSSWFHRS